MVNRDQHLLVSRAISSSNAGSSFLAIATPSISLTTRITFTSSTFSTVDRPIPRCSISTPRAGSLLASRTPVAILVVPLKSVPIHRGYIRYDPLGDVLIWSTPCLSDARLAPVCTKHGTSVAMQTPLSILMLSRYESGKFRPLFSKPCLQRHELYAVTAKYLRGLRRLG